jgi:hypothetical protein
MDWLPNEGSYFDDMRSDDDRHAAKERRKWAVAGVDDDMVPFFSNIRNRPYALVLVKNQTVAKGIRTLMEKWHRDGLLREIPEIVLNDNQKITEIKVTS